MWITSMGNHGASGRGSQNAGVLVTLGYHNCWCGVSQNAGVLVTLGYHNCWCVLSWFHASCCLSVSFWLNPCLTSCANKIFEFEFVISLYSSQPSCPSWTTLLPFKDFTYWPEIFVGWCTVWWSRMLCKMAMLGQFLLVSWNFEIFHDRFGGSGPKNHVTALTLKDYRYVQYHEADDNGHAWTNFAFYHVDWPRVLLLFKYLVCSAPNRHLIAHLNTVGCRYHVVKYNMILDTRLQWLRWNLNQSLNLQKTPHTWPWRASHGVSFVRIVEKIDHVIMAPHCIEPVSMICVLPTLPSEKIYQLLLGQLHEPPDILP